MSRSHRELVHNVRVNGRIIAAFRRARHAEAFAFALKAEYPDMTVEAENIITLLPEQEA